MCARRWLSPPSRSHRLEYVDECPIASPAVTATGALAVLWPGATELEVVTGTGTDAAEALVSVAPRGRSGPRLPALAAAPGLVVGGKVRRPPGAVHAVVAGRTYRTSPGVFWQVHTGAAAALLRAVLDFVGPCDGAVVVDLYAGAGLFADMRFTMARPEESCHPETLLPGARTVVSAALCYWLPEPERPPGHGR